MKAKGSGRVGRGGAKVQAIAPLSVVHHPADVQEPQQGLVAPEVMTRQEAARFLRVSLRSLDRLPLPRIKLGHRTVRYLRADLEAYLAQHREAA